jgi:hypothetical protein
MHVRRMWSTPRGVLLGEPDACIGASAVPGVLHDVGLWGLGRGMELRTTTALFILMGVRGALELAFERLTGRRMGEFCGWAWIVCWGTLMIDGWARRGIVASDFFPGRHGAGKRLVNTVIALSTEWR